MPITIKYFYFYFLLFTIFTIFTFTFFVFQKYLEQNSLLTSQYWSWSWAFDLDLGFDLDFDLLSWVFGRFMSILIFILWGAKINLDLLSWSAKTFILPTSAPWVWIFRWKPFIDFIDRVAAGSYFDGLVVGENWPYGLGAIPRTTSSAILFPLNFWEDNSVKILFFKVSLNLFTWSHGLNSTRKSPSELTEQCCESVQLSW